MFKEQGGSYRFEIEDRRVSTDKEELMISPSLTKFWTGFLLTLSPWPPFSKSIYFRKLTIVNSFCSSLKYM